MLFILLRSNPVPFGKTPYSLERSTSSWLQFSMDCRLGGCLARPDPASPGTGAVGGFSLRPLGVALSSSCRTAPGQICGVPPSGALHPVRSAAPPGGRCRAGGAQVRAATVLGGLEPLPEKLPAALGASVLGGKGREGGRTEAQDVVPEGRAKFLSLSHEVREVIQGTGLAGYATHGGEDASPRRAE